MFLHLTPLHPPLTTTTTHSSCLVDAYISPRPPSDNSLRAPRKDRPASVGPERQNKDQSVAPGRSLEAHRAAAAAAAASPRAAGKKRKTYTQNSPAGGAGSDILLMDRG